MGKKQYLKGFSQFSGKSQIFEMASELTKIGVPRDLMQFIHKLTGEEQMRTQSGMIRGGKFRTLAGEYGGDWPSSQDIPLSDDVKVIGTKTGSQRIYSYLTGLPTNRDVGLRLILVNPDEELVHLINRKTGKTKDWKGYDPDRPEVSQKRGFYMRIITIDRETGEPVAAWRGTISQLLEDVSDNSILYVMEDETRALDKKIKRGSYKMTDEKFLEYFTDTYSGLIEKAATKKNAKAVATMAAKIKKLDPNKLLQDLKSHDSLIRDRYAYNLPGDLVKFIKKAIEINSNRVDLGHIKVDYAKFLEYLADNGNYEKIEKRYGDSKADLNDVIAKHSLMGTCSKFLQFISTGKTASVSKDIFTEMGLEDLGLGDDFEF